MFYTCYIRMRLTYRCIGMYKKVTVNFYFLTRGTSLFRRNAIKINMLTKYQFLNYEKQTIYEYVNLAFHVYDYINSSRQWLFIKKVLLVAVDKKKLFIIYMRIE